MALPECRPPDWTIDWKSIDSFAWMQALKGCPQNPDRHAEGDVWTHVHLVIERMAELESWRSLAESDRRVLFWSALLHDVAKPNCTRIESDGRVSAKGHSWRGAVRSRGILWKSGASFAERERVCAIVRHHLVPFFLQGSEDPKRIAIETSQTVRCDHLAIMAEADARGRICPNLETLLDNISAFKEICRELGCLDRPYEFSSDRARVAFFRRLETANRADESPGDPPFEVVLMCGLPSAGKDHWIEQCGEGRPVVSPDEIRREKGLPPTDPTGEGIRKARETAITYLNERRSFIWNAPNLSRNVRAECLRLFEAYRTRVRIVYVEADPDRLAAQNQGRKRRVPDRVIEKLLDRWEVPDLTEAHQVEYIV